MTLSVTCPNCDKTINADEKFAGKSAACPGCGHTLEIPKVQPTSPLEPPARKGPPPRKKSAPIPDMAESPSKKTTKPAKFSRGMKITAILFAVAFFVGVATWMLWPSDPIENFDPAESFNQFAHKKYENYQQESVEPTVIDLGSSVTSFSSGEPNRSWCKVWRVPDTASFEIDVEKTMSEISPYMGTLKFSEKIFFSERFESKESAQACEGYAFQKNRSIIASFKFIKGKDTWEPAEPVNDLADSRIAYPFEDAKLPKSDTRKEKTESQELELQTAKEEAKIKVDSLQKKIASAEAYYNQGYAWIIKGEYDKAIADYTEVIRLIPKYAKAYFARGLAWSKKGEYDKAIADYTEAIRLNPKYAVAYCDRGYAWFTKGEYDIAIADCNEAIRLDPTYADAYCNRGNAWFLKSEYYKAIADYNEAIRFDPKSAKAYFARGLVWEKMRNKAKARADFNKAKELGFSP